MTQIYLSVISKVSTTKYKNYSNFPNGPRKKDAVGCSRFVFLHFLSGVPLTSCCQTYLWRPVKRIYTHIEVALTQLTGGGRVLLLGGGEQKGER